MRTLTFILYCLSLTPLTLLAQSSPLLNYGLKIVRPLDPAQALSGDWREDTLSLRAFVTKQEGVWLSISKDTALDQFLIGKHPTEGRFYFFDMAAGTRAPLDESVLPSAATLNPAASTDCENLRLARGKKRTYQVCLAIKEADTLRSVNEFFLGQLTTAKPLRHPVKWLKITGPTGFVFQELTLLHVGELTFHDDVKELWNYPVLKKTCKDIQCGWRSTDPKVRPTVVKPPAADLLL